MLRDKFGKPSGVVRVLPEQHPNKRGVFPKDSRTDAECFTKQSRKRHGFRGYFSTFASRLAGKWRRMIKVCGVIEKGYEKKVVVLKRLTTNLEKSFRIAKLFLPLQPATEVKGD